jgi:hypothetical protein
MKRAVAIGRPSSTIRSVEMVAPGGQVRSLVMPPHGEGELVPKS